MTPPAFEIRLTLPAPGMEWNYLAHKDGEEIAASSSDSSFRSVGAAFSACVGEINASLIEANGVQLSIPDDVEVSVVSIKVDETGESVLDEQQYQFRRTLFLGSGDGR